MPYIFKQTDDPRIFTLIRYVQEYFSPKEFIYFRDIEELQKLEAEQLLVGLVESAHPITIGDDESCVRLLVSDQVLCNAIPSDSDKETLVILIRGNNIDGLDIKENDIIVLSGAVVIPLIEQTASVTRVGKDLEVNLDTNTMLAMRIVERLETMKIFGLDLDDIKETDSFLKSV